MIIQERLYVTMTSWTKRINNVKSVLESIVNQTITPYKIILNLCTEDFPNMEKELPEDLLLYVNEHNIEIYWFIENYKFWKKHLHTLDIVNDNDLIVCIDDDCLYPEDFLEKLYMSYCYYGKKYPITTETLWLVYNLWPFTGSGTLYWKSCLPSNYKKYLTNEVLHKAGDDFILLILFCMNKTPILPIKYNFPYKEDLLFNEVSPTTEISQIDIEHHNQVLFDMYSAAEHMLAERYFTKNDDVIFTPSYWKVFVDFYNYLCTIQYPFPEMEYIVDIFRKNWLNPTGVKSEEIKKKLHLDIQLCK